MTDMLDLADIQGNILSAYGRLGFPKGRMLLINVRRAAAGRAFVEALRHKVTTALRWPSARKPLAARHVQAVRPDVAINLAFTFRGLLALEVPTRTLRGLPDEFLDGMIRRGRMLGDEAPHSDPPLWDSVWTDPTVVHILVTLNAPMQPDGGVTPALQQATQAILDLCQASEGGVVVLDGHRGPDPRWQEMSALLAPAADGTMAPTPKEHFGFTDAIGDPVFEGQYPPAAMVEQVVGNGKLLDGGRWAPLATGEFLLGHPDEAQEIAGAAMPLDFSRNGTFMAYRKLHQNTTSFRTAIDEAAAKLGVLWGIGDPEAARETLMAKLAGRWSDGIPLMAAPDFESWLVMRGKFAAMDPAAQARALRDFSYAGDRSGAVCPMTSHMRRVNTRDGLDPLLAGVPAGKTGTSVLNNRRRILRRGLPYGSTDSGDDADEHGIVMLNVCASLFRQFEFVQQQWVNYGLDANAGNDTCPLVGAHGPGAKFVIPVAPDSGKLPFIMDRLPQFVATRGGEYFFVPSMTSLRMIAMGVVDPT